MLFNVVKAALLVPAIDLALSAFTPPRQSTVEARSEYGRYCDGTGPGCQEDSGYSSSGGVSYGWAQQGAVQTGGSVVSTQATSAVAADASLSVGLQAMTRGWQSLTPGFNQLHATFTSGASVEVAIKAAISLQVQIRSISRQFQECGCSASTQAKAQFQQIAAQFFTSMQLTLQAGQQHYAAVWQTRFRPIFQGCWPAFVSLQGIAASIQADLGLVLQSAHVDVKLFANVGLNLSALLDLNLSIGGLLPL